MKSQKMLKAELHVLEHDLESLLTLIGKKDIFEFDDNLTSKHLSDKDEAYSSELRKIEYIKESLYKDRDFNSKAGIRLSTKEDIVALNILYDTLIKIEEDEKICKEKIDANEVNLKELKSFYELQIPIQDLEHFSFFSLRYGKLEQDKIESIQANLEDSILIIKLSNNDHVLAIASKKGRFALDSELKKQGFLNLPFPEMGINPLSLIESLEIEESNLQNLEKDLAQKKALLQENSFESASELYSVFKIRIAIQHLKQGLDSSTYVYKISGWIPASDAKEFFSECEALTQGRIAISTFTPEELESVISGKEQVPVKLKHSAFVKSFEGIVFSYGTPLYGSIDPTPFVAAFFIILFSIMFGDVGQGFLIFLTGIILSKTLKGSFQKWAKFGPILISSGLGSMVFGFLDGTVFTNEHLLVPLTKVISEKLFGFEMDRFIQIMPEKSVDKLFIFFGFTIGIGVVFNSIGLIINIINCINFKKYKEAFFSKTGLAGASFFWYAIFIVIRIIFSIPVFTFDFIILCLPLLVLFFEEILGDLVEKKKVHLENGLLSFIIKGFVEILESVSYYLSNTVSFLRVGAFALSHAVLSFIVFTMAELMRTSMPLGFIGQIIILIIGNAVILVLEGMIVTIQVVRLQYYEFFSKFFTESGRRFKPFKFSVLNKSRSDK